MRGQGICVVRPLHLGDLLCTVPALRALKAAAPGEPVALVGLPWARDFARRFHRYVDAFIPFPGWPGIPEREPSRAALCGFYASCRERPFGLALQLHGDGSVMNRFLQTVPARAHAGFAPTEDARPSPLFARYPAHLHEVLRPLALLEHLGVPAQGEALEFPLTLEDHRDAAEALALATTIAGVPAHDYVVLHPGARATSRRWPAEDFACVADALAAEGCTVVLTGTEEEREVVTAVQARMESSALDVSGHTSLGGVAALVHGARLLVSNDTGISHVAAALRTPSTVVFTGSERARWAPLDGEHHVALGSGSGAPGPAAAEVVRAARALLRAAA